MTKQKGMEAVGNKQTNKKSLYFFKKQEKL